jgi:signal peptidase
MPPDGEDGGSDDPDERGGDPRPDDEPSEEPSDERLGDPGDEPAGVEAGEGVEGADGIDGGGENGSGDEPPDSGTPFVVEASGSDGSEGENDTGVAGDTRVARDTGLTDDTKPPGDDSDAAGHGDPLDVSGDIGPGGPGEGGAGPEIPESRTRGPVGWFLRGEGTGAVFLREFLGSVLVIVIIGMLLFAISGVWPPMVAVKSGSMEPQMERGDLVFVMEEHRFPPDASIEGTGIATYESAAETGYQRFGDYGDVIIYRKDGEQGSTPIIHRARFWVNDGENWYDRADEAYLDGENCEAVRNCPAPHAGFITKGDANDRYDQVSGISDPVRPEWVKGTAELRIPWLGHIRLELTELTASPASVDGALIMSPGSGVPGSSRAAG